MHGHGHPPLAGTRDDGVQNAGADAATLECRVNYDLTDVEVVWTLLYAHVPARLAVGEHNLEPGIPPVALEEPVLRHLVQGPNCASDGSR